VVVGLSPRGDFTLRLGRDWRGVFWALVGRGLGERPGFGRGGLGGDWASFPRGWGGFAAGSRSTSSQRVAVLVVRAWWSAASGWRGGFRSPGVLPASLGGFWAEFGRASRLLWACSGRLPGLLWASFGLAPESCPFGGVFRVLLSSADCRGSRGPLLAKCGQFLGLLPGSSRPWRPAWQAEIRLRADS